LGPERRPEKSHIVRFFSTLFEKNACFEDPVRFPFLPDSFSDGDFFKLSPFQGAAAARPGFSPRPKEQQTPVPIDVDQRLVHRRTPR